MNTRKIKLALTVGLLNKEGENNVLSAIKELMSEFKEVGAYIGWKLTRKSPLNPSHVQRSYALRFENCTLNVDLVSNPNTKNQFIQGFDFR